MRTYIAEIKNDAETKTIEVSTTSALKVSMQHGTKSDGETIVIRTKLQGKPVSAATYSTSTGTYTPVKIINDSTKAIIRSGFYTYKEAGELLRVSTRTIARMCQAGKLEAIHNGKGAKVLVTKDSVEKYIDAARD